jgi:hypothetical protein
MVEAMTPEMTSDGPAQATTWREQPDPAHAVIYRLSMTEAGDLETGAVLLDGRLIGRLRHRIHAAETSRRPFGSPLAADPAWHAEAVGWVPHGDRPWDTHVTSTAPTRRRAAEDLMRAYRNPR